MFASSVRKTTALIVLSLLSFAASGITTCSLSIGNVVFGNYDVFNPNSLDTSTSVVITCNRFGGPQNVTVEIGIDPGSYGGSTSSRKMRTIGGDLLGYNLFKDAGRTAVWGQVSGLDTLKQSLSVPNNSSAQTTATIFGRISAGQNVSVGDYNDSVSITVMP